jgi:hypothetical protein
MPPFMGGDKGLLSRQRGKGIGLHQDCAHGVVQGFSNGVGAVPVWGQHTVTAEGVMVALGDGSCGAGVGFTEEATPDLPAGWCGEA